MFMKVAIWTVHDESDGDVHISRTFTKSFHREVCVCVSVSSHESVSSPEAVRMRHLPTKLLIFFFSFHSK